MKDRNRIKKALFMLAALFFILTTVAHAQETEIKSALKLLGSEHPNKALDIMAKASQTYPDAAKVWYYLGYIQAQNGDKKNAEISFQKGIEKDPKDALNLAGKGYLRMLDNNTAEAKQLFDQALAQSKSKNPEVLRAVAEGYLLNDKMATEALNVALKAKSINDAEASTQLVLGDAYLKQSPPKGGDAVSSYERAAKLDPTNGLPWYKAALVFFRSKNNQVAEEDLIKATTADPNFAPAFKELGELYYTTKQSDKAVAAQESYLKTAENPEKGKFAYAFYLFQAKKYDQANQIFKDLVTKPDATPTTWKYAAYSLTESKNLAEAKTTFDTYFSKSKDVTAGDYAYYGKMLQEQGLDSLAVRAYLQSYRKDTTQIEMLEKVADMYFKGKKYDSAALAYQELIPKREKLKPGDFYNLGRAQYATKSFDAADSSFKKLIELAPNMTIGYQWAGRASAALDPDMKKGLAKPFFEQLIEKAQTNPEKSKRELIEGYGYLSAYAVQIENNMSKAKEYLNKILALDSTNKDAQDGLKAIREAEEANRKAQQQQNH